MFLKNPLAFLAVLASLTPGLAQTKSDPAPAPSAQDFSKEAYVIDRYYTHITEAGDGNGVREVSAEVKVLAEAGVKTFAVLNFTYTSANQTVEVDYVRVRKPDGTVVKTPDYNIQDMPAEVSRTAPLYSDIHEKHVAVKGLAVGDVLEYLVRYRTNKPEVPGHFWYESSFIKDAIIKDEQLEIDVPADKYVKVVSPDFKPEIKDGGGRRVYRWTHSNLAVKEKDPKELPLRIPPNPSVQLTTFATWADVGAWYGGLQKDSLQATPAIQAKAAELTKGLKTDDEKIRALYNFVALRFHYIGLDFGIGRYQPHSADDVLDNAYGDCKDKHTLLATLLKAVGIDAWPVLIHASRKLDPDVPSPAQFNHVITVVPNRGKLIWLDTTPEVAPYQLLTMTLRDKQALVIPSDKPPLLMTTPANPPFPEEQRFTSEGKLDSSGTFTGHVEQFYRGDTEVALRIGFRQLSQSQWKEGVQRFSYGLGFGGDVSNVTITPPDETDKPFQISYDYLRKDYGGWDDHQITPPVPPNLGIESTKDSKRPQEPVLLGAPGEIVYNSKLELPKGYSVTAPAGVDLVEPYAEYHATSKVQDGVLISSRRLVVKKSEVPLADWESYRDFGKAVSDNEWKVIPLNSAGAVVTGIVPDHAELRLKFDEASQALQRGDRSRAQELLEQIIRSDPKYPLAHLKLGSLLMMESKTKEGLAEFSKEQEVNPGEVRAFQVPASYLTFMNRKDEAIEAWRKVLKVDPKNHDAALKLSGLLTSQDKAAEAAVVLEDAVKESPDSQNLRVALGVAYLRSGQGEKAMPYVQAIADKADDPLTFNELAYDLAESKTHLDLAKDYGEKSLHKLEQRSMNDIAADDTGTAVTYQFSMVWDTVGWVYFQMGDAAKAESFVRASWVLGQQGVVGEHLGEIYEKLGKKTEAAHAYELAMAASFTPVPVPVRNGAGTSYRMALSPSNAGAGQSQYNDILTRYEKLTGKQPSTEIHRRPNGEWTMTPAEELSHIRAVKVSKQTTLSGAAEFSIVFTAGRVESVRFRSGDGDLESFTDKLKTVRFPVEFPTGSPAKLLRIVEVSCHPVEGCNAVLETVDKAEADKSASLLSK